jgi:hypothetical protein
MAGLVPAIHDLLLFQDVDARHKAGHDEVVPAFKQLDLRQTPARMPRLSLCQ